MGSAVIPLRSETEMLVRKLADCKMQEQDVADTEARKNKEIFAVFCNVEQAPSETTESLKENVG